MVLFNEILEAAAFGEAANNLGRGFIEEHGLPEVHQLGLVVPDVEAAAAELESRGMGPFLIASGSVDQWQERGEERSFSGKMGLAYHRGFQLELLEPGQGSDFYRQCLDPEGKIVVQHLGLLVSDVDEWTERLVSKGTPIWVRGRIKAGPIKTNFAYMDTMEQAGIIIEFISFGRSRRAPPARLIHLLGRLQKWTGKRSFSI